MTPQQISTFAFTLSKLQHQNKVLYINKNDQLTVACGNICLYHELGSLIDVVWDSSKGNMLVMSSAGVSQKEDSAGYIQAENLEIFLRVEFRHAHICPYQKEQFVKSEKFYKPCACVLLVREQDGHVLVTRRKLTLNSFPGAWVLPGGHLEKGQTVIQGGLRESFEQVGLEIQTAQIFTDYSIMAWQSAFCINNKIVSSSFVIFFSAKVPKYEVKPQQTEIEQFIWKDVKNIEDKHKYTSVKKDGYGQAHLNYLSFYRFNKYGIEETKPWVKEIDEQKDNIVQSGML